MWQQALTEGSGLRACFPLLLEREKPTSSILTSYFNSKFASALVLRSVIDCVLDLVISFWKVRAWGEAF